MTHRFLFFSAPNSLVCSPHVDYGNFDEGKQLPVDGDLPSVEDDGQESRKTIIMTDKRPCNKDIGTDATSETGRVFEDDESTSG